MEWEVTVHSVSETRELGRKIAYHARPGLVVALVGPLGAGKTVLVRGLAEGLEVPDPSVVSSPTFVLLQVYEGGKLPLYHFDAYRLHSPDQLREIGAEEIFESGGVCAVEWADRVAEIIPPEALWVELSYAGDERRRVRFRGTHPGVEPLAAAVIGSNSGGS